MFYLFSFLFTLALLSSIPLLRLIFSSVTVFSHALYHSLIFLLVSYFLFLQKMHSLSASEFYTLTIIFISFILSSPAMFVNSPTVGFFLKTQNHSKITKEFINEYFDGLKIDNTEQEMKSLHFVDNLGDVSKFGFFYAHVMKVFQLKK